MLPILREGLVLELHFNELNGSIVYDLSGYNNNGTIYGATRVNEGFVRALSFDGMDDYVRVEYIELPLPFTVSFWFRFPTAPPPSRAQAVIDEGFGTGYNWWFHIDRRPELYKDRGVPAFATRGGGSIVNYYYYLYSDRWYHITVVSNAGMYVNGELVVPGSISEFTRASNPLYFMRDSYSPPSYTVGYLDEVLIYNRALSEEEIKTLYNYYTKKKAFER